MVSDKYISRYVYGKCIGRYVYGRYALPLAARSLAVALPRPVFAPVTIATFPSSLFLLLQKAGARMVFLKRRSQFQVKQSYGM